MSQSAEEMGHTPTPEKRYQPTNFEIIAAKLHPSMLVVGAPSIIAPVVLEFVEFFGTHDKTVDPKSFALFTFGWISMLLASKGYFVQEKLKAQWEKDKLKHTTW